MKTPSLKVPHIKFPHIKISKGHLILAGVSLLALTLVIVGLASYQKHQIQLAAQAAVARETAIQADKDEAKKQADLQSQVTTLTATNTALTADKTALCTYTKPVVAARAVRTASHCL